MPTVVLNKKTLHKLAGKKLSDKQLEEKLTALGIDVNAVLETEVEVEIAPNRPDWLSEQGIARSLSSFIGIKQGLKQYKAKKAGYKVIVDRSVASVRPNTACAVVKGLKLDDEKIREIIQVQEKLHATYCRNRKKAAIGIYPMEKISWPVRYTAKKPGDIRFVPLEFSKEMSAKQILSEHPAGKAYAHLLENKPKYPLFVDAKGQTLSMPPIINSQTTGKVTEKTTSVFIECSGFDQHTLNTLLNIIVTMLADMNGQTYSVDVEYSKKKIRTPQLEPKKMKFDPEYANKILGTQLKQPVLHRCLKRMGYGIQGKNALIPSYRADVLHPIDLVEDIAIAYGYDAIGAEVPAVATIAAENKFYRFKESIKNLLVGLELIEAHTYALSNERIQNTLTQAKHELVELANARTVDYSCLRAWILPTMLEVLKTNKHRDFPQKIFTIGPVFKHSPKSETGVSEPTNLCIVSSHAKADYTEIKQTIEYLLDVLGIPFAFKEEDHPSFVPGRTVKVLLNNKEVGVMGELHPSVINNFNLEMPVAAAEITLTDLFCAIK